jgi:hypothetical protein
MPPVPIAPAAATQVTGAPLTDEFMSAEMPEHINAPFAPPGRAEDKAARGPKVASIALVAAAVAVLLGGGAAGIKVLFRDDGKHVNQSTAPNSLTPSFAPADPGASPSQAGQLIVPAADRPAGPTASPSLVASRLPTAPKTTATPSKPRTTTQPSPTAKPTPSPVKPPPPPPPPTASPSPSPSPLASSPDPVPPKS